MKTLLYTLTFLLLINITSASISISEVMYNPPGSDKNREWIEIHNPTQTKVNITGWRLLESDVKHILTIVNGSLLIENYAIIVDDVAHFLQDYPTYNGTLIDSSFSLSNSGESLLLLDQDYSQVDNFTYNNSIGGDGNGKSILLVNNQILESNAQGGTPGTENQGLQILPGQDLSLEVYSSNLYAMATYTKLFKLINVNPEFGQVKDINITYNITIDNTIVKQDSFVKDRVNHYTTSNTGDFTPTSPGNYTICGNIKTSSAIDVNAYNDEACDIVEVIDASGIHCNITLNLTTEKNLYQNKEQIKLDFNVNNQSFPYIIQYGITNLHGEIVKKFINTTNTNHKIFTPSIKEKDEVIIILADLAFTACNNSNTKSTNIHRLIIVNSSGTTESSNQSNISIGNIFLGNDNKAKFGDLVRVVVNAYRGDTGKKQIKAYIEDKNGNIASQVQTTFNIEKKFTEVKTTIPVKVKDNCNEKLNDGDFRLIVEGLELKETQLIEISSVRSDNCEEKEVSQEDEFKAKGLSYLINDQTEEIYPGSKIKNIVKVINRDSDPHLITIWSYIYRGSKSYSGNRTNNTQVFSVKQDSNEELELVNILDNNTKPGEYTLAVNLIKDDQKTVRKIRDQIIVLAPLDKKDTLTSTFSENPMGEDEKEVRIPTFQTLSVDKVIFKSSSARAVDLVPTLLIIFFGIYGVIITLKRIH